MSSRLNATGAAKYDAQGGSSLQTDFHLATSCADPKEPTARSPLEAKLKIDASLTRTCRTSGNFRSPHAHRARDERIAVQRPGGYVPNQRHQGSLKLAADSPTWTHYYDISAENPKPPPPRNPRPRRKQPRPRSRGCCQHGSRSQSAALQFNLDVTLAGLYLPRSGHHQLANLRKKLTAPRGGESVPAHLEQRPGESQCGPESRRSRLSTK